MGGVWEGPEVSFGDFGAPFGRFLAVPNYAFFKHGSKMGSKRPFGSILDRFGGVLGGLWMDFERFWEGSGRIFCIRTPALSREAPRSVPMRGGPGPQRVE